MKYLVVIPCYNEEKTIVKVVEDIVKNNFEYIIINDCSTDRSLEIIQAKKFNYLTETVKLFKEPFAKKQKKLGPDVIN